MEFEQLQLERTKIEAEKGLKTHEIEIQAKATSTSHTKQGNIPSIKLLKLEPTRFDGDILKLQAVWDSFEAPIYKSPSLQDVDKFNYLKGLLKNEAKDLISGLEITGNNYEVAVDLLKERYDRKELMINAHYLQLHDLPIAFTYYEKLRTTYDHIEQHLRSLPALGENMECNLMISLIQLKLPRTMLAKLEVYKKSDDPWAVE